MLSLPKMTPPGPDMRAPVIAPRRAVFHAKCRNYLYMTPRPASPMTSRRSLLSFRYLCRREDGARWPPAGGRPVTLFGLPLHGTAAFAGHPAAQAQLRSRRPDAGGQMEPLGIDGSWIFTPKIHRDGRGSFLEMFRGQEFADAIGYELDLAQANCSVSHRGALRGIHFADVPPGQ